MSPLPKGIGIYISRSQMPVAAIGITQGAKTQRQDRERKAKDGTTYACLYFLSRRLILATSRLCVNIFVCIFSKGEATNSHGMWKRKRGQNIFSCLLFRPFSLQGQMA